MQPADCANGRGRIALATLAIIFDLEQEWNPESKKKRCLFHQEKRHRFHIQFTIEKQPLFSHHFDPHWYTG